MSVIVKRYFNGISTCADMHDHGNARVRVTYDDANPLVFTMSVDLLRPEPDNNSLVKVRRADYEIYRESVHFWLLRAPAGGMLTLGQTSIKVRTTAPYLVTFRYPTEDLGDGYVIDPMFMMNRELLQRFLADTYAAVPAEVEDDFLNVDVCITKILERGFK